MTLLEALRPTGRSAVVPDDTAAVPRMSPSQFGVLLVILAVLLAGVLVLLFGPARGLRNDIADVDRNLSSSREGIYGQLGSSRELLSTARVQLRTTEQSLVIQERGLEVAVAAEQDATTAAQATQQILEQTREALTLVRDVTSALGPLGELDAKAETLVRSAEQGVRLAQSALRVAEQTLATGQQALAVARDTLTTLRRSEQVQRELLATAKATLQETREINRKIPGAPVFPTGATAAR